MSKSLRELNSILKKRMNSIEEDIKILEGTHHPQELEILNKLKGEKRCLEGIMLYATTGQTYLIR